MRLVIAIFVLFSVLCAGLGQARAREQRPEGIWLGTLDAGPVKLRLAFHVERAPDGGLRATFDSLDQGVKGMPVVRAALTGVLMRLELAPGASFEGQLDGDGLVGQWMQGGKKLPLVL